jgi:hypothetical protein
VNRETEGIEEGLWLMGLVTNSRVGLTTSILAERERKPKQDDSSARSVLPVQCALFLEEQ